MKKQFPVEQAEEIDAVVSCFGEEFVSVDASGDELNGTISVVLEPRPKPIVISATDGKDYGRFETAQLSPLDLHFRLPQEYPAKQAILDVDSVWLPNSMRATMLERLGNLGRENLGFPVLFLCCEDVKKFIEEIEIVELILGENSYARKNNLRPLEMLEEVREECDKAELLEFEAHCHDCDVCFENKLGRECVRFSPCGHTFCKECVIAYLNEKLNSQEIAPLTCLGDDCDSSVPQKLIIELIGQEAFDRYERILLSRVLDTMDDLAICPRISCQKPASLSRVTESLATCLVCGFSFCTKCRRTFHGLQPCRSKFDISVSALVENEDGTWGLREVTLQEYLRATPEERIEMGWWYGGIENLEAEMEEAMIKADGHSYLWIQENSKKCPKCSIPIQKTEGCNKMICAMCKTIFCFRCEEIISQTDPYSHFQKGRCKDHLFDVPDELDNEIDDI